MSTKELILLEAFKLFSVKPYDKVTYTDLQNATSLSRGAILYHVKTKVELFSVVVNEYIFKKNSIAELSFGNVSTLRDFIDLFIKNCKEERKALKKDGIENICHSVININSQGLYFCPQMKDRLNVWFHSQENIWIKMLKIAIDAGELKEDVDPVAAAKLFTSIYNGLFYAGSVEDKGYNLEELMTSFENVYSYLKK